MCGYVGTEPRRLITMFFPQILWLCEMTIGGGGEGGSGRRQQSLSDMTAFYCFSEAKTHLHILWNTVRLAHGSKGKRVLFRLILLYFNKKKTTNRTLWGIKTAGQAAKSTCEASQIQQLKWTNSHILFFSYKRHEWRKDVEQLKE